MTEAQGPPLDALRRALHPRYLLERPLGRGGMGVVYLATDVRLDRPVAIKVLPPNHATEQTARARFVREARTAARLSHPNIVAIHAVEEWEDLVYYAMAYVEGETLEQRVRRLGPLAPLDAARLLRDVAWALAYAHARGVIHRDIKPDNILFDAGTGRAMVTDFGIAWVDSLKTNTGPNELFGTPEFMSPEQARGGPVDGRSDTYSLGVVGFYALTGRVPFEHRDPQRLEVAGSNRIHVDSGRRRRLPPGGCHVAIPQQVCRRVRQSQRHDVDDVGRDDAWCGSETLGQRSDEIPAAGFGIAACFEIEGRRQHACRIEASTNLIDWLPVATNSAPAEPFDFVDGDAPDHAARFYRVKQ